jgi:hypothetical protein
MELTIEHILILTLIIIAIYLVQKKISQKNNNQNQSIQSNSLSPFDETENFDIQNFQFDKQQTQNTVNNELCNIAIQKQTEEDLDKFAKMESCDCNKKECSVCSLKYKNDVALLNMLSQKKNKFNCVVDNMENDTDMYIKKLMLI